MKPTLFILGSYVQDLTTTVETFPAPGESVFGSFKTGPGGKGSNQAVAAHRLGATVHFVTGVGTDAFGREARDFYHSEGLANTTVEFPDTPTATASILVDRTGQNKIAVDLGASALLEVEHLPLEILRGASIVVGQLEANPTTTFHALREAKTAGATTILNTAPMNPALSTDILPTIDWLIPNENEFCQLLQHLYSTTLTPAQLLLMEADELHQLCQRVPVPQLLITLGEQGCFLSTSTGGSFYPAYEHSEPVRETVGAGDAFVGAFAYGLSHWNHDHARAIELANTVAGISVTRQGAAPSLPHRSEIALLLEKP